ncbi:hypothetical protein NBO_38g0024 [Nosema bombycis CQ1]|uniref:Uncharacterized protein n=1 Tax=Nosema bombycis (strain CQ1 / CVCC 102059) TaxID=578461 RepID=R0MMM1_NOSB1|nr:hypothetical protein NBO_38g0024 [Nosema bombycis CQ1]|eukprot:EOB14113.1 hypothetical protein NBO_38g0024 [Nosema bombycis CQ1]
MMNEINPYVEEKYKIKKDKVEEKGVKNEEMPIEETVLIKEIEKPNGLVVGGKGVKGGSKVVDQGSMHIRTAVMDYGGEHNPTISLLPNP